MRAALLLSLLANPLVWGVCHAAPPLEAYGRLPAVELMRLSPSGERYTFVADVDGVRKLCAVSYDGKLITTAPLGKARVRDLTWAGDDHILVTTSALYDRPLEFDQPFEMSEVVNIGLARHSGAAIFDREPGVASTVRGYFGAASVEGHLYGWFGGLSYHPTISGDYLYEHSKRDLYRVDLESGAATLQARGDAADHWWVLGRDGTVLAHSEYTDSDGTWRLYAGPRGDQPLLERQSARGGVVLAGPGRTPGTVLVLDRGGDEDLVQEVAVAGGAAQRLFADVAVEEFLFDRDSGLLIGALTQDEPGAVLFEPRLQARYNGTRKSFPGEHMRLVSYSRGFERLLVATDGAADSGTYWLIDIASGRAEEVGHPYAAIRPQDVGPVRAVRYSAADGTALEGILTLPPGRPARKLPLVVMPHGGPIGYSDRVGFDWWAQAYAAAGYAVLQPNFRGSGGHGRTLREAGYGEWGRKMLSDISDGIAPLAQQGIVDGKRVCIAGASYGGYAALAGVTVQQGIYRCAVSVGGPSDMPAFLRDAAAGGAGGGALRYLRAATGADKEGDGLLRAISPLRHAGQADAPILLIHGNSDTRVSYEQSQAMADALRAAGKPYALVTMNNEDHFLSREDTRIAMLQAALAFVKRYNPPDAEAPALAAAPYSEHTGGGAPGAQH